MNDRRISKERYSIKRPSPKQINYFSNIAQFSNLNYHSKSCFKSSHKKVTNWTKLIIIGWRNKRWKFWFECTYTLWDKLSMIFISKAISMIYSKSVVNFVESIRVWRCVFIVGHILCRLSSFDASERFQSKRPLLRERPPFETLGQKLPASKFVWLIEGKPIQFAFMLMHCLQVIIGFYRKGRIYSLS